MEYFDRRVEYYMEHPHDNNKSIVKLEETKDNLKFYIQDIDKKLSEHELNFAINFIADEIQEKMSEENNTYRKYEKEKDKILKVQELTLKFIEENYVGQEHDKLIEDTTEIVSQSLIRLDKECVEETGKTIIENCVYVYKDNESLTEIEEKEGKEENL